MMRLCVQRQNVGEKSSIASSERSGIYDVVTIVTMGHNHKYHTVKTFELLQTYFGHLSCMPVVYVTCCKT